MPVKTLIVAGTPKEYYNMVGANVDGSKTFTRIEKHTEIPNHAEGVTECKFIGSWRERDHEEIARIMKVLRFYNIKISLL